MAQAAQHMIDELAAAPPWFIPFYNRFKIDIAILQNKGRLDGSVPGLPLGEVLFPNGDRPTQPPHNLPLLDRGAVVDALTDEQANDYFQNYYPDVLLPDTCRARKREIKKAIGCILRHSVI